VIIKFIGYSCAVMMIRWRWKNVLWVFWPEKQLLQNMAEKIYSMLSHDWTWKGLYISSVCCPVNYTLKTQEPTSF
jgi:hypothetical protein